MKKIISLLLIILIFLLNSVNVFANPQQSETSEENKVNKLQASSPYVILLDLSTGNVLYSKNAKKKIYPASLTEIMTAVVVLENANLEKLFEADETALSNVRESDSKMGILKGERLSVRQLLYGMLLSSASDAANVLAQGVGGSIDKFVEKMNLKAKELGLKNTNFTNPTGFHDERHVSTAADMAKLTRYAMSIPEFCEIVKTSSYNIMATEQYENERKIINRNHFVSTLLRRDYYYKYSTGIKTGYTVEAKSCIAASVKKNNVELLCLIFGAKTQDNIAMSFVDCKNLFDYIFENYNSLEVVNSDEIVAQTKLVNSRRNNKVLLKTGEGLAALKHKDKKKLEITYKDFVPNEISAPVKAGEELGKREYFLNGASVGVVSLVADKDYKFDPITFFINKLIAFLKSPWLFVCIGVIIILLILKERHRRKLIRKKRREAKIERNKQIMNDIDKYKSQNLQL